MSVIAEINGEQITMEMLDSAVGRYIVQLEEDEEADFKPTKENMKFIKAEVLNFLMERKLLLKRALEEGFLTTDAEVDKRVGELRKNFSNSKEWEINLAALKTDEPGLFIEVRNDLVIEKYLNSKLDQTMKFGEKELRDYYNDNEDAMRDPDLFSFYDVHADTANEIKAIYAVMQKYSSFEDLKKELDKIGLEVHSHRDIPENRLSDEINHMLGDLEPGKIATLEAPEGGMSVFKLISKTPGGKIRFEDIKEKLAEYLMHKARKETIDIVITEEMEKAAIEYKDITYLEK